MQHCTIEDCENKYYAKGWCAMHYQRNRIHGDPNYVEPTGHPTHFMSGSVEHSTWKEIRKRIYNPNCKSYPRYGGRGITMSSEWSTFANFYRDMGPRPGPGYSVERIRNHEGYSKENCVWADKFTQANNKRTNIVIEHLGRIQTLAQWCEELKLDYEAIRGRWHRGGQPPALFRPIRAMNKWRN